MCAVRLEKKRRNTETTVPQLDLTEGWERQGKERENLYCITPERRATLTLKATQP